ncbi:DUF6503 family protein [Zobellia uliginosa]|uniref:DUF6503 family protein n=1 Tax=Zobellia uliginosa TaxID=143224 RepID=UPI0026E3A1A7|nr:DUF6503 family protein [Zobellia uliginosa]MDO6515665.1 hypothetical protein [Zobellia uliginosa]
MKNSLYFLSLSLLIGLSSCKQEVKKKEETKARTIQPVDRGTLREINKADALVNEAIDAHGGQAYDTAYYGFTFRKKEYTFHNKGKAYTYSVTFGKNGQDTLDVLDNGKFVRKVNGKPIRLSEKDVIKHTEALNSVIYFATLPHKLKDKAVNKTLIGPTKVKGGDYKAVKITFDQNGGGTDHDDVFMYWINQKTKTVDYLAYKYSTNNGGVRFRSAYNRRNVDGIVFQDYINYKAPIGTPLKQLPELYEKGALEELSKIETEKVVNLAQ